LEGQSEQHSDKSHYGIIEDGGNTREIACIYSEWIH